MDETFKTVAGDFVCQCVVTVSDVMVNPSRQRPVFVRRRWLVYFYRARPVYPHNVLLVHFGICANQWQLITRLITRTQSETADLRQRHVVGQVAAPYSVWQRFSLCPIESNVNENFKVIQNPGFLPDHLQNWITGSFCHPRHSQKISERSVHNLLSYLADTQTDRQTNKVWQKHYLLAGGNQ